MIYEHAIFSISPGTEADFEAAFVKGREVILAGGALSAELSRCAEEPSRYLLRAAWESVEAHNEGFRKSPAFSEWRSHVGPYFAAPPDVTHYEVVVPA